MASRNQFMDGMAAADEAEDDIISVSSSSSYSGSRRSAGNQVDEEKELRDKIIKKEERGEFELRVLHSPRTYSILTIQLFQLSAMCVLLCLLRFWFVQWRSAWLSTSLLQTTMHTNLR
jgi:hypothetical protein